MLLICLRLFYYFLRVFYVVLGFVQGKDLQTYPPNITQTRKNPSLTNFICFDPRSTENRFWSGLVTVKSDSDDVRAKLFREVSRSF